MKAWFTRTGETKTLPIEEATEEELLSCQFILKALDRLSDTQLGLFLMRKGFIMVKCPFCENDNPNLIDTRNHRREQMDCHCNVCAKDWVMVFANVPRENIIPVAK